MLFLAILVQVYLLQKAELKMVYPNSSLSFPESNSHKRTKTLWKLWFSCPKGGKSGARRGLPRNATFLAKAVLEVLGDGLLKFGVKNVVDLWCQIFCRFSPGKIDLQFVTENFTVFFTARKEICQLELALGLCFPFHAKGPKIQNN